MKIAATITGAEQVSEDAWNTVRTTKIFNSSDSIDDILKWASDFLRRQAKLSDFTLAEVVE